MFWDGRAPSLEGQAQGPVQNPIEMGNQNYEQIIERLAKIPGYIEQFEKVFGTPVTLDGMAKAIATFERVAALSGNSPYDKYNAGDNKALSESEKRGLVLFGLTLNTDDEFKTDAVRQKAKCTLCHQGFNFTDEGFHNLGIGLRREDRQVRRPRPLGDRPHRRQERRRHRVVQDADAARDRSYRHLTCTTAAWRRSNRSMEHYDKGGTPNPSLDPDMKPLKLTAQEKADVVAFMKALERRDQEARRASAQAAAGT